MGISKLCCHNSESGLNSRTPFFQRFACGVGHVMNDITRQLLFSFRLVIFMQVFGLSAANAGWLMLYGLITGATSSAIGAFLIDNFKIPYLSKTLGKGRPGIWLVLWWVQSLFHSTSAPVSFVRAIKGNGNRWYTSQFLIQSCHFHSAWWKLAIFRLFLPSLRIKAKLLNWTHGGTLTFLFFCFGFSFVLR